MAVGALQRLLARTLALAGIGAAAAAAPAAAAMQSLPAHHLALPAGWLPRARFTNPWPTWTGDKTLGELLEFWREMRAVGAPSWGYLSTQRRPSLADMSAAFPIVPPDAAALAAPPPGEVQATWIGHASLLVQMEGVSFLTDPVFSQRAAPVQFLGPQRAVQPALVPEDPAFPKQLDFVVISHCHFDHLDADSVRRLVAAFGQQLAWYVPLGLKAWFTRQGIHNVTELDWWQEVAHPGSKVRLVFTPAQHWSARGAFDRRATLWGGWAVLGGGGPTAATAPTVPTGTAPGAPPQTCPSSTASLPSPASVSSTTATRFWFAGDTGYCAAFREVGERLGPFDLAAIPIGAYLPRGFMRPMHINPEEAVQVHKDVRSRRSIGIHCCTFYLTTEPMDEPPRLLQQRAAEAGLVPDAFVTLRHGATLRTRGGRDSNAPELLPLPAGPAQ